jgi:uncharacterized repeat protein (TIGR03803 family)
MWNFFAGDSPIAQSGEASSFGPADSFCLSAPSLGLGSSSGPARNSTEYLFLVSGTCTSDNLLNIMGATQCGEIERGANKRVLINPLLGVFGSLVAMLGLVSCPIACCVAQTNFQSLMSVTFTNSGPGASISPVCDGTDGMLYGVTSVGGISNRGTLFRFKKDGSGFSTEVNFVFTNGASPCGRLVEGGDGMLYGVTTEGGTNDDGIVYKVNKDGSGFSNLHTFSLDSGEGGRPPAGLMKGTDGGLYGTTSVGGAGGAGTVFRLNQDGSLYTTLHSFGARSQGTYPFTAVTQGSDGFLYGTTSYGGAYDLGVIFKVATNGSSYQVLHDFAGPDGRTPFGDLITGANDVLFGTTYFGGTNDSGTVFKLQIDGSGYTILYHFAEGPNGRGPSAGVVEAPGGGALYGTTRFGGNDDLGTVFRLMPINSDYTVLHSFSGGQDSGQPAAALLACADALFGSTLYGGTTGTIFKVFLPSDSVPPSITILGQNPLTNECHSSFVDPGATTSDSGSGVATFFTNSTVNPNSVGVYSIRYIAIDGAGNSATNTRTVRIVDTRPPTISLNGSALLTIECHTGFSDLGATVTDTCDPSAGYTVSGTVNPNVPNTYILTYLATDASGNTASTNRTVVVRDTSPPVITNCVPPQVLSAGSGSTATLPDLTSLLGAGDACSASIRVKQSPAAGTTLPLGTNTVQFAVDDGNGNTNQCSTTVAVNVGGLSLPTIVSAAWVSNRFLITFTGPNGQSYHLIATSDIASPQAGWTLLTNGTFNGLATFVDSNATNFPARFYRIKSP